LPFDQILERYFPSGKWMIEEKQSGWNNTTRFVEADGKRWILRIYETHKDADKVRYEHELLRALNEIELPYQIPVPVSSDNDHTLVTLTDGTDRLACLFTYIEGYRPEIRHSDIAYSMGQATGQLSIALSELKVKSEPLYPPYYEMDNAHPLCTPEMIMSFCSQAPFEFLQETEQLRRIGEAIERFRAFLPQLRELPHQLIHGDINHSNLLVTELSGSRIAAILDFEFCTYDLRVMELAVVVSGFMSSEHAMKEITLFLSGVGEQLRLERIEAEVLPLLVELRILDVFLHFLGRYLDGVDGVSVLREQTLSAYEGLKAIDLHKDELKTLSMCYLTN
jgi:homoserine kinase type II